MNSFRVLIIPVTFLSSIRRGVLFSSGARGPIISLIIFVNLLQNLHHSGASPECIKYNFHPVKSLFDTFLCDPADMNTAILESCLCGRRDFKDESNVGGNHSHRSRGARCVFVTYLQHPNIFHDKYFMMFRLVQAR